MIFRVKKTKKTTAILNIPIKSKYLFCIHLIYSEMDFGGNRCELGRDNNSTIIVYQSSSDAPLFIFSTSVATRPLK